MPLAIEDYALIADTETAGLVGREGSIDWLCLPGNFPQAFSHVSLVNTAYNLTPKQPGPAEERKRE